MVIAIIAILAGLLLPALAEAKKKAQRAQCISQNKQIALAFQMYGNDFGDVCVWPNWGVNNAGWLYFTAGGGPPAPTSPDPATAYQNSLLWDYVATLGILLVPAGRALPIRRPVIARVRKELSTYTMNGSVLGFHSMPRLGFPTHKTSEMNPEAFMLCYAGTDG